jgi:hypothetical protein
VKATLHRKELLGLFLASILTVAIAPFSFHVEAQSSGTPDVLVGIHVGYGDVTSAKNVIDRVHTFTNFIEMANFDDSVPNSQGIKLTAGFSAANDYARNKGMYFSNLGGLPYFWDGRYALNQAEGIALIEWQEQKQLEWLNQAYSRWGSYLVGFYPTSDEPGGRQLDFDKNNISPSAPNWIGEIQNGHWVNTAQNYAEARSQWQTKVGQQLTLSSNCQYLTSDYALYWFDYKAGFNTVLAELFPGADHQLPISFCRGAATAMGKDWGVMFTWSGSPQMESKTDLYNDMVYAYDSGAKYIVIFDSNAGHTASIMQDAQYQALQDFWNYIHTNQRNSTLINQRTAFVLPSSYGYGFRWSGDKIWGWWPADQQSINCTKKINTLLTEYGYKLDIVYDEGFSSGYSQVFRYDQPLPTPTPMPTETPAPTSSPTAITTNNTVQNPNLTPSPSVPEFPAWLILPIALFVMTAIIAVRKRSSVSLPIL